VGPPPPQMRTRALVSVAGCLRRRNESEPGQLDAIRKHRSVFTVGAITAFAAFAVALGVAGCRLRQLRRAPRQDLFQRAPIAPAVADRAEACPGDIRNASGSPRPPRPATESPTGSWTRRRPPWSSWAATPTGSHGASASRPSELLGLFPGILTWFHARRPGRQQSLGWREVAWPSRAFGKVATGHQRCAEVLSCIEEHLVQRVPGRPQLVGQHVDRHVVEHGRDEDVALAVGQALLRR
jgi:hypothetical protein